MTSGSSFCVSAMSRSKDYQSRSSTHVLQCLKDFHSLCNVIKNQSESFNATNEKNKSVDKGFGHENGNFKPVKLKLRNATFPNFGSKKKQMFSSESPQNFYQLLGGNYFSNNMQFFAIDFCWHFHFCNVMNPFLVNYLQLC